MNLLLLRLVGFTEVFIVIMILIPIRWEELEPFK